eukprot:560352-Ditylum_brightwellii.AAC.1
MLATVPGHSKMISFHRWLLTVKTADNLMLLFTLVDSDPNKVYYFCTETVHQEEAARWPYPIPEFLCKNFMLDYISSITTEQESERSYKENPAKNTNDAVKAFDTVLN